MQAKKKINGGFVPLSPNNESNGDYSGKDVVKQLTIHKLINLTSVVNYKAVYLFLKTLWGT